MRSSFGLLAIVAPLTVACVQEQPSAEVAQVTSAVNCSAEGERHAYWFRYVPGTTPAVDVWSKTARGRTHLERIYFDYSSSPASGINVFERRGDPTKLVMRHGLRRDQRLAPGYIYYKHAGINVDLTCV
jgi:hypothetical protein